MPGLTCSSFIDNSYNSAYFNRLQTADLPYDGMEKVRIEYGLESRSIAQPQVSLEEVSADTVERLLQVLQLPGGRQCIGGLVLASCTYGEDRTVEDAAQATVDELELDIPVRGVDKACSGFIFGLEAAAELVEQTGSPTALVATEFNSRYINWGIPQKGKFRQNDEHALGKASKIFGDGSAGVLVFPEGFDELAADARHDILHIVAEDIEDPDGLLRLQPVHDAVPVDAIGTTRSEYRPCISLPGRSGGILMTKGPGKMIGSLQQAYTEAVQQHLVGADEQLDLVMFHQANAAMLANAEETVRAQPWVAQDAAYPILFRYRGNISGASLPAAMAEYQATSAAEQRQGRLFGLSAVGAGGPRFAARQMTRGAVIGRW